MKPFILVQVETPHTPVINKALPGTWCGRGEVVTNRKNKVFAAKLLPGGSVPPSESPVCTHSHTLTHICGCSHILTYVSICILICILSYTHICALTYTQINSPNTHFAHACIHICTLTLTLTKHTYGAQDTHTHVQTRLHTFTCSQNTHLLSQSHTHTHTASCSHTCVLTHTHTHSRTHTHAGVFPTVTHAQLVSLSQAADSTSVRRAASRTRAGG